MSKFVSSAGRKLKLWRLENNLSTDDVADKISFSPKTIASWEYGQKLPSYDAIISVADLMGVSTDYLLGRTQEKRPVNQLLQDYSHENNS